ncbi:MAG: response regulator [Planctomycetota bacterium]|nr:response regulator [Planctomycetota bacterium]
MWNVLGCVMALVIILALFYRPLRRYLVLNVMLRRAVGWSPGAKVLVQRDGGILFANGEFCRLLGEAECDIAGRFIEDWVPETYLESHREFWEGYRLEPVKKAFGQTIDVLVVHKEGTQIAVETALNPVFLGNEVFILIAVNDIRRRVAAENEAREKGKQLGLALRAAEIGTFDWDMSTDTVQWDDQQHKIFGVSKEAFDNQLETVFSCFHPDDRMKVKEELTGSLERDEVYRTDFRVLWPDGQTRYIEGYGSILRDHDGLAYRVIGCCHDVTERHSAKERLVHARDEAEALAKATSAFLANMSHEIRTPLNGIIGLTTLLYGTSPSDKQVQYLDTLRHSGDMLLTILNNILDFSKIEAGEMTLEESEFKLQSCIEDALDLLSPMAAKKSLDMAYTISQETGNDWIGDPTHIRQVLVNLLNNAIKFTDEGQITIHVDSEMAEGQQRRIHMAVSDTGLGVEKQALEDIMKPFRQADVSLARSVGGTGLGLSICQHLARLMGGELRLESEGLNKGMTAHFSFLSKPRRVDHSRTDMAMTLRGLTVFAVEPTAIHREALENVLGRLGLFSKFFETVSEALGSLLLGAQCQFMVISSELMTEAFRKSMKTVRENRKPMTLPVIVLGPLGVDESQWEHVRGHYFAISKPIKQQVIAEQLSAALQKRARKRASSFFMMREKSKRERSLRILLAEDNPTNQMVTTHLLKTFGYNVEVVGNGLEACEATQRQFYDIIFMDIQMPEMDGLAATKEIRRQCQKGEQPWIVALTANVMSGARQEYLENGMDDFLGKPLRPNDLSAALDRAAEARGYGQKDIPELEHEDLELEKTPTGRGREKVVDWDVMRSLVAVRGKVNVKLTKTLIEKFLSSFPGYVLSLKNAVTEGNMDEARRVAHNIYGSSATYGVARVAKILRTICDDEGLDDARAKSFVKELDLHYSDAVLELRQWENHILNEPL